MKRLKDLTRKQSKELESKNEGSSSSPGSSDKESRASREEKEQMSQQIDKLKQQLAVSINSDWPASQE